MFFFISLGKEICNSTIWKFICSQEDGLSEHLTVPECIMYFLHTFPYVFQHVTDNPVIEIIHDLEKSICRYDLIAILKSLVNKKLITIRL
jgi:hypothetical protein